MSADQADAQRQLSLLEASTGPSPLLDARLVRWAGGSAPAAPTGSLEGADAFVQAVAPGATWTLSGGMQECTATITSLRGKVACVTARGSTPALALLAALLRALAQR